jgi:NADH-quinone oxidoreductase subunit G
MPKIVIDGKEMEFAPGENIVEVARRAGIEIPVFCYHPGLSVVAQCRMCAVEIEKSPKLQTACSTPAVDGMVVKTTTEKVRKNQRAIMEFLLINHPLDCPICDKSGECDLQDLSYEYGDADSRCIEPRRTYADLDMGPVIKKNMNRCIHCTRCIRFGDEVAGIREMIATKRGNETEISTLEGRPLETSYSGNYSDICPTGSLTLKDFRFKKRAWYLSKTATVCEGCSKGCSIELQHEGSIIYRCVARSNPKINGYWICDEGRFNFHYLQHKDRVTAPMKRSRGALVSASWKDATEAAIKMLAGRKTAILAGSDLTIEEAERLKLFAENLFPGAGLYHFGTPGVSTATDDEAEDKLLRRKSKTANLHGLEALGYSSFKTLPKTAEAVIVARGGRAVLPEFAGVSIVGLGVFNSKISGQYEAILPGQAFAEKDGTVVNFEGIQQRFVKCVEPPKESRTMADILRALRDGLERGAR